MGAFTGYEFTGAATNEYVSSYGALYNDTSNRFSIKQFDGNYGRSATSAILGLDGSKYSAVWGRSSTVQTAAMTAFAIVKF